MGMTWKNLSLAALALLLAGCGGPYRGDGAKIQGCFDRGGEPVYTPIGDYLACKPPSKAVQP